MNFTKIKHKIVEDVGELFINEKTNINAIELGMNHLKSEQMAIKRKLAALKRELLESNTRLNIYAQNIIDESPERFNEIISQMPNRDE